MHVQSIEEWFSTECCKIKTKLNYTSQSKKTQTIQRTNQVIQVADAKCGKMHADESQLVLVLFLIGWKSGTSVLNQSLFDTQTITALTSIRFNEQVNKKELFFCLMAKLFDAFLLKKTPFKWTYTETNIPLQHSIFFDTRVVQPHCKIVMAYWLAVENAFKEKRRVTFSVLKSVV